MAKYHVKASRIGTKEPVRLQTTPSARAKSMFYYVQEIGHLYTRPDFIIEKGPHPTYLIMYTHSGKGALSYQGKEYVLEPGHILFIDCSKLPLCRTSRYEHWEVMWLYFNGCSSQSYYEQWMKNGGPVLRLAQTSPVPGIMKQLLDLHLSDDIRKEIIGSHLITHMLTELLLANGEPDQRQAFGLMPDYIRRSADYIDKYYAERITLDRLSKECSVSKYHLAHEFKKYTGFAPNEYVIHVRITETKKMLKHTDLSVTEIASRVGIDSATHFINLFKRVVGQTPLAYRKKWRQNDRSDNGDHPYR